MIYLWTDNVGWEEFDLSNASELQKRKITIGARSWIGDGSTIGDEIESATLDEVNHRRGFD